MRWRGEWWFLLLSVLALASQALAGSFGERELDVAAVLFALLALLALRPDGR